ncbi:M3 family metallopeptidase [Aliiglaciecola sp. 3_MG-2023]|uniref:M3 family metallopeptidase n=1 Tax=Aliiglaciecola sp. 3_MG-2023 TaxID=3062644 RepID=UPI0026E186EA|nr:M3 family metallopeptidase [Aliiglaciecola sp. 3_MG-2023]MDO6692068.1 M3 family metallopeptidase [Aliiglaciecola sp. 3_MG-2023]
MKKRFSLLVNCIGLMGLSSLVLSTYAIPTYAETVYDRSAEQISKHCSEYLAKFDGQINALAAANDDATYDTVFKPLDDYIVEFGDQLSHDYLMQNVHIDKSIREASADCALKGFSTLSAMNANRPLYERMSKVTTQDLSDAQKFTVNYWKQQFEMSGIGKDKAMRERIQKVNDEINEISQAFDKNITDSIKSIQVKPERLAGLPQDYLDSHRVNEDGLVTITTAYPDIQPIFKYAHDASLREETLLMESTRAMPENQKVLQDLLSKRYELAKLLGHNNFAETNMLGTMVQTPQNVVNFMQTLSDAIKSLVVKEKALLLAEKQTIDPSATQVQSWDASYLQNVVREKEFKLDAKLVRQYFSYGKVRDGILALSEDLFGLTIKPSNLDVWHQSVEPYDVFENGKLIGQFYLDSHPREGKFTHAAQFPLAFGKQGGSTPKAVLLMNFPDGLMEHGQVKTFLHEYGHLLHFIFAGQNEIGFSSFQGESDFGEAPSTMLEEWVWDYDTLKQFAVDDKGQVIPKSLVEKMNQARYFGRALNVANQLTYAALSFELYNQNPEGIDLNAFEKDIFNRYSPYGHDEGTYTYASFGHLTGYGAKYYTYQWSNSIAEELLSRFKKEGLRNTKTADDYRHMVLARVGTKPAAELVKDFLGRNYSVQAYADKLANGSE